MNSVRIHPTAQRSLVPSRLRKLKEGLDLDAIGALHAVRYEIGGVTSLWIIDGQHRVEVLVFHGFGEWIVQVILHVDVKDDQRASELFLLLQERTVVDPRSRYNNALRAGHRDAAGVDLITAMHGLKIGASQADGTLTCITALLKVWNRDQGQALDESLKVITGAWGNQASALEGKLVEGIAGVMQRYRGVIDTAALIKKLAKYPGGPSGLIGDAKGIRDLRHTTIPRCVAEQCVAAYNSGRAYKLDPL